jgi:cell division protein FtsW
MGESTFMTSRSNSVSTSWLRRIRIHVDWPLAIAVGILLLVSFIFVFSASVEQSLKDDEPFTYYGARNLLWIVTGCILGLAASAFNYRKINKLFVMLIMALVVGMLVYTVIANKDEGAGRSIFGASGQPTEFVKLGLIIYLSVWLTSKQDVLSNWSLGLIPFGFIVGSLTMLIIMQGDFSAALTVLMLGIIMFILSGGKWRQTLVFIAVVIAGGALFLILFGGNRKDRIIDFINGLKDPYLASEHVQRASEAISSGGFLGVGLGESIAKYTGLPVPWTDSIFAVIVEEVGSIFGLGIIGIYMFILWRGLTIANRTSDLTGKLIASGISIWIALEAAVNIGALINAAPFGGNALPMISYGGSSMWATLIAVGILMNISQSASNEKSEEGRNFSAVVDLRRRNRRRSISRPSGS